MHAAYGRNIGESGGEAMFRASFPEPVRPVVRAPAIGDPQPAIVSRFGEERRPNWAAILFIIGLHALLLTALVKMDVIEIKRIKTEPLVVNLIPEAAPPPPPVEQEAAPPEAVDPPVVAPKALVAAPVIQPLPVAVIDVPPRATAVVVAPAPPAPAAPVAVADLSSKLISGSPPKYPIESRRKREQGTVILSVLLGLDGTVTELNVSQSSGYQRLDKAALDAVRRWRWSPTLRGGVPMMVRGFIDIPFVLQG
jgi:protein TonB